MSTDIRNIIKTVLGAVSATIDDGVTVADILIIYEGGPEVLKYILTIEDMDAVITVGRPQEAEEGRTSRRQDVPLRYNAQVPVDVTAIDKTGVTATKLLNKIRDSLIAVVEAGAQATGYTLITRSTRPQNQRMGGFDPLWRDSYMLLYRPMES